MREGLGTEEGAHASAAVSLAWDRLVRAKRFTVTTPKSLVKIEKQLKAISNAVDFATEV